MEIMGKDIVLYVPSIFILVSADDAIFVIMYQFGSVYGFAVLRLEVASCLYHVPWDAQTDIPVDRAPSIFIMSRIIVEACDFVAEKSCAFSPDVCDQGFLFGEFELECVCEVSLQLCL